MTTVLIMAGGRGQRLHPLTEHTPKPMLQVGQKPMLETIIEGLVGQGFDDIILAVHYKADLISDHFGDGARFNAAIGYIYEKEPLGTAGALRLLPTDLEGSVIVVNADIITDLDYNDLMKFHNESGTLATICLALHQYQVPFGVAKVAGDKVYHIDEKPISNFQVNAGIYVIHPFLIDLIPREKRYDMPDLLEDALNKKAVDGAPTVSGYVLSGCWADVGTFEAYREANGRRT